MVNRNLWRYSAVKFTAKITLIIIGYLIGKRWGRRPIEKGFSEKRPYKNINN